MITSGDRLAAHAFRALLGLGLCAYAWVAWRTAWLSDDAFISLRTAANFLDGHGLTWNVGERVQTFTHPLWLFALIGAHALTSEPFYSTLYLSLIVSCAAVATLLFAAPGRPCAKLLALAVLCLSRAFMDFSSSGLENPLTHLLLAAFASAYFAPAAKPRRAVWLAAIAGACALNRLDSVLLVAPALGRVVLSERSLRALRPLVWTALPIAAWEGFSLFYYGFPFPNTAYAKLSQGPALAGERWSSGLTYVFDSLQHDPLTLCTLAGCTALALWRRDAQRLWLLCGAGLYVGYAVSIGGDFMSGRFFAAPLFLAACCLGTSDWLRPRAVAVAAALLVAVLAPLGRASPPWSGADYGAAIARVGIPDTAIHDERALFFTISSLRNAQRMSPAHADHLWARGGRLARAAVAADREQRVRVIDALGYAAYYAGSGVHVIDHWALADALIARLPAVFGAFGHYPRVLPSGYVSTLRSGKNVIADPRLAAYYDRLALAIRAPLWSLSRLAAIAELNSGALDHLVDAYAYRRVPRFAPHVRIRNPGADPAVIAYVWNDWRLASYVIDAASKPGSTYEVDWQIDASGARLRSPAVARIAALPALRDAGMFTISVGFGPAPNAPPRAIYELRYGYSIADGQLLLQPHAWPTANLDFPKAPWRDGDVSDVLHVERVDR
jgi:arabinofuranosyltransferase